MASDQTYFRTGANRVDENNIKRLVEEGHSPEEIAEILRIRTATIDSFFEKYGGDLEAALEAREEKEMAALEEEKRLTEEKRRSIEKVQEDRKAGHVAQTLADPDDEDSDED